MGSRASVLLLLLMMMLAHFVYSSLLFKEIYWQLPKSNTFSQNIICDLFPYNARQELFSYFAVAAQSLNIVKLFINTLDCQHIRIEIFQSKNGRKLFIPFVKFHIRQFSCASYILEECMSGRPRRRLMLIATRNKNQKKMNEMCMFVLVSVCECTVWCKYFDCHKLLVTKLSNGIVELSTRI